MQTGEPTRTQAPSDKRVEGSRQARAASVSAWDLPTRLFHWSLVVLVAFSWFSFQYSEILKDPVLKYHRWAGLLVLTLLVWRLLWGIFGSSTSRFKAFLPGLIKVTSYASAMLSGREPKYLGHNPLGALMIFALLGLLIVQATLGLFSVEHNDLTAGPLYRFISEAGREQATDWHVFLFNTVTLWLIGLHILANVFYALFRGEPLIKAMLTGHKPKRDYADAQKAEIAARPLLRATVLLALSAVIVFGGIWAVGGKFLQMRLW